MPSRANAVPAKLKDEVETAHVDVLGQTFEVYRSENLFNLLRAFDPEQPSNLPNFLIDAIVDDDRKRFITAMAQQRNLDDQMLIEIFDKIVEAQADGRPQEQSSGSRTGSSAKAVSTRSAGV